MKKTLLDVIFASEKRKQVILLLKDKSMETGAIMEALNTTRQALLPQMKILKNYNLVVQSDDTYSLTTTGKLIADELKPFMDIIETLDETRHYFTKHNVEGLPENFLKRISEIRGSHIIEPSIVNSHDLNMQHFEISLKSNAVYFVFTFMHPDNPSILKELTKNNIELHIIFSKELVQKLKKEYSYDFAHFNSYDNVHFYLYQKEINISSLTVTDSSFLLRLLYKNNEFSNKHILCLHQQGRQWGKDLFDHYMKDSIIIAKT